MIRMGARGHKLDGTGGEIAVYWGKWGGPQKTLALLPKSKFSYWLFNFWCRHGLNGIDDARTKNR